MSDILLDTQGPPATPAAGQVVVYADSLTKRLATKNADGIIDNMGALGNNSTIDQGPGFAADTYLVGSAVPLLSVVPRVGMLYRCSFDVTKTAAGVAAPAINLRFGILGTTADASRLLFTFPIQTAVIDDGMFEIWALFRSVGAAGVLQGRGRLEHGLSITGLSTLVSKMVPVTSAAFDTTLANAIIGLSVNGGAAAAWTVRMVEARLINS